MEQIFNAEEMNALANAYVPTEPCPLGDTINHYIRAKARMGHHYVEFISEDKINYIELHKDEYISLGFDVSMDSNYDFPCVTISW